MSDTQDTGYEGIRPAADPDEAEPLNGVDPIEPQAAQEIPADATEVECVFLIAIGLDGSIYPELDPNRNFAIHRQATPHDIATACWSVSQDYTAMRIAAHVTRAMEIQAQATMQRMQQAQEAERARQQVASLGDLRMPPNRQMRRHPGG